MDIWFTKDLFIPFLEDINKVRAKAEGNFWVEESRQKMAKSTAIAVAQNNATNEFLKHYEVKRNPEEKKPRLGGKFDQINERRWKHCPIPWKHQRKCESN